MKRTIILFALLLTLAFSRMAPAAPPEIANVHPDWGSYQHVHGSPHIITGEGFMAEGLEVWTFFPSGDEKAVIGAIEKLAAGGSLPQLPSVPPQPAPAGSRVSRVNILDVDGQVLTTSLGGASAVWIKTKEGYSAPCPINIARPFWVGNGQAEAGSVISMFGYGMAIKFGITRIALISEKGKLTILNPGWNPRGLRDNSTRLLTLRLPAEMEPGAYRIYVHNGFGGEYGWRSAGGLWVLARVKKEERTFNVREFGAKGDGRSNDFAALTAAAKAAAAAGGGVVFLPAGTYMTDESLRVPAGVTLRGESREVSRIRGFNYDPQVGRKAWWSTDLIPASVLILTDDTALESLSVDGYLSKGAGGRALIEAHPAEVTFPSGGEVADILIRDCGLTGTAVHPVYGTALYRGGIVFRSATVSKRLRLIGNQMAGGIDIDRTYRTEIADNTVHQGGVTAIAYDSLLDGNFFVDAPARVLFHPVRHSYMRYNEMRGYFRDSWQNAPEPYLTHGGEKKTVGSPTSATETTLTDARQNWTPGQYADEAVLITAGRGFGQYRFVGDNTKDTLTVTEPWRVQPDESSEYAVGRFYVESVYYANSLDSTGVLSLWLDCINMTVETNRFFAAGMNVWGRDASRIDKTGALQSAGLFCPSWYNMFVDNWMDGSALSLDCFEDKANAYRGPTLFGTYVLNNRFMQPQMERIAHSAFRPYGRGGVKVNGAARWTVIYNNFFGFSNIGVFVDEAARKTFVMNNEFQEIKNPVLDRGSLTLQQGNKLFDIDTTGEKRENIPDMRSEKNIAESKPRGPQSFIVSGVAAAGPFDAPAGLLPAFVSYRGYNKSAIESEEVSGKCRENLRQLYGLLQVYEKKNGFLPKAAFYPQRPFKDADSIAVILGQEAAPYLRCPAAGPDFDSLGWPNYIWNSTLNGKKLSEIKNPKETWLMMDFTIHDWMVEAGHCGHRGGLNILFADGGVRHVKPFKWADWRLP